MLPAVPAAFSRWRMRPVVVVLPLVPVTPIERRAGAPGDRTRPRRARGRRAGRRAPRSPARRTSCGASTTTAAAPRRDRVRRRTGGRRPASRAPPGRPCRARPCRLSTLSAGERRALGRRRDQQIGAAELVEQLGPGERHRLSSHGSFGPHRHGAPGGADCAGGGRGSRDTCPAREGSSGTPAGAARARPRAPSGPPRRAPAPAPCRRELLVGPGDRDDRRCRAGAARRRRPAAARPDASPGASRPRSIATRREASACCSMVRVTGAAVAPP